MSDFERINAPRVEKIMALMGLITKSGASTKATLGEFAELYRPVLDELAWAMERVDTPPAPATQNHPSNALNVAREATLREAVDMMSIIATRIEQELWEKEQ